MQHAEALRKPGETAYYGLSCGQGEERCTRLLCGVLCSRPSRAGLLPHWRFRSRLAAKTERLRQLRTLRRIVRSDERVVALEVEGGAIFGRRQMMFGPQVTLQSFELLSAAQANNRVGRDGFFDRNGRLPFLVLSVAGGEGDGIAATAKASFDGFDHRGEVGGADAVVGEVGGQDLRDERFVIGFGHD